MAVADRTLMLKLIGDVNGLKKTDRQLGKFSKSVASWGKALAGGVLIGGVERLGDALGDAYKGYRSGEKAAGQLRRTWKNLGLQGKAYNKTLGAVIDSTLELGTSDDEAVEAFSRSLLRTKDYSRSLRELSIAQDLVASGAATNLEGAFRLIQQAGKGSARVVDRFGLSSKTAAGRIRELGDSVKGTAKQKARLQPLQVLFNRMAEDTENIVGAFVKGDFKGFVKGLKGLGNTVADALFGPAGKNGKRDSASKGLVNQFGKWAGKMADEIAKVDWGKAIGDGLQSGIDALATAGANGTLSRLAVLGTAIMAGLFAADLAITALTALFSVPKLLVKGVVSAIVSVGTSIAATMFGAEKVTTAAATALSSTITTAGGAKVVATAAEGLGGSVGTSMLTGFFGKLTSAAGLAAVIGDSLAATVDENGHLYIGGKRVVLMNKGAAGTARSGARGAAAGVQRRSGGGFASGTSSASRGWHWVGERGPELMRFGGGEKVIPNGRSMAMAGGGGSVTIHQHFGPGADPVAAGREVARVLREYEKRAGKGWRN